MKQISLFLTFILLTRACCASEDSKLRAIIQTSAITGLPRAIEQELRVSWYGANYRDQDGKAPLHDLLERVLKLDQVSPDENAQIKKSLTSLVYHDADPYLEDKAGISPIALAQQYDTAHINDFCNLSRTLEDAFIVKYATEMRNNRGPAARALTLTLLRRYKEGITAVSSQDITRFEQIMRK